MLEIFPNTSAIQKTRGSTLLIALFIIVVLALLATLIFRMNQTATIATAQETLSIRAFYAAESGAQTAAMQVFPLSGGLGACTNSTINFSNAGLINCSAVISCQSYSADGEQFFDIASVGRCGSLENEASRTIEVLLKQPN